MLKPPWRARWLVLVACTASASVSAAQDLEPRRWTHLPVGTDILGASYVFTTGDLDFDPVLLIDDADVDLHTALFTYSRYFALADRTARIDVVLPVQSGEWNGLVDGVPRSVSRDGLADPALRLSTNLIGAPALTAPEYLAYRREHPATTTVGAALELRLPLGEYEDDRLINLGQNRWVFGSQLGALHTQGEWSFELTGTMLLFTDNDSFFDGNELEQDPLYIAQTHVVKTFGRDWWVSAGAGYSWAGESSINGVSKDDEKSNVIFGGSFGFRLGESQGIRLAYARNDTRTDVGGDTDSFFVGWSTRF